MAGSWDHIVTKNGKFRGAVLLDNLGDAHEALEECFGMVWYLAELAAGLRQPDGPPEREVLLEVIGKAQLNYKAGLRKGGVQKRETH